MDLGLVTQVLLSGLGLGAVYALVAFGFGVVFNATGAINFAQGEYVMLAGVTAGAAHEMWGLSVALSILVAIAVTICIGLLTEVSILGLGRLRSPAGITIATIAVAVIIKGVVMLASGRDTFALPGLLGENPIRVGSATTSPQTFVNLALALVVVVLLTFFFKRSKLGTTLRAAADDDETLQSFGISFRTTARWAFVIAALLGAIAGAGLAPFTVMSFDSGTLLGLKGFAAAMLGGLGNPYGALAGGLLLGIAEAVVGGYGSPAYADTVAFVVLLLVLFTRPAGIMGRLATVRT